MKFGQKIKFKPSSANNYNSKNLMAKSNPNRQELLEFINLIDKDLPKADKIEDLSSGVHYLYVLHKVHPNVVKLGKVNLKAFLEHENVNNLKLLAHYLSEVKTPFTFEVPKVAARNYQQNLNLLKNLYKYYYSSQMKGSSIPKESKEQTKPKVQPKKAETKIVVKPPQKLNRPVPIKKFSPDNSGLKGIVQDAKSCMEQIKKILVVVQEDKTPQQEAAEQKLMKIKKILGLEVPYSQKKKKPNQTVNFSNKCSASKTNVKKDEEFEQQKTQLKTKTEEKSKTFLKNEIKNGENKTDANKKNFDCEQIKQSVISKYNVKSNRKSFHGRRVTVNQQKDIFGTQEDDERYNESLLSPVSGRRMTSKRKSIIQRNESKNNLSQEKNQPFSMKKEMQKSIKKIINEINQPVLNKQQSKQPQTKKVENQSSLE